MNEFITVLWKQISPAKQEKILSLIQKRTKQLTIVLEDIEYSDNINAALRSCEAFGIQDVHIIENSHRYLSNSGINKGSAQWLSLHRYNATKNNTLAALQELKKNGYTLVATTPHAQNCTIDQIPVDQKVALLFGTEETGLSPEALAYADLHAAIPISGFTQSFNISVSVAICLYDFTQRLRQSKACWQLPREEQEAIILQWLMVMVRGSKAMLEHYKKLP